MATTPNMNLELPTVGVTEGPEYASENNTAFETVDSHDHTSGKGVLVPTEGLNINADLPFNEYNATLLRSVRCSPQGSPINSVSDLGCLYVAGVDLYFNDVNGNQIQLTAGGALNAASIGGIGGDYATSDASCFYTNASTKFTFWQDTNEAAIMDMGPILLRKVDAGSAAITIAPAAGLASGYSLTLPSALPASTSFVGIDSSGNLSFGNSLASLTLSGALVVGGAFSVAGASTFSALTASTVPYLDASKILVSSAVTPTELGYLSGAQGPVVSKCATTVFTSSGTWTKATLNPRFVKVTVVGGGGSGGGAASTSGSEAAMGGGGGGGGVSFKTILAASLGATESVTVGAGGAAPTAGANNGNTGGTSSFGSHCSATGGVGGSGMSAGASGAVSGGDGGTASGGDVNLTGENGFIGQVIATANRVLNNSGGGNSLSSRSEARLTSGSGNAGRGPGGGGSGGNNGPNEAARTGGAGATGRVIVEEFY